MSTTRLPKRPMAPSVPPKRVLSSVPAPQKQVYGVEFLYLLIENAYGYIGTHKIQIKDAGLVYVQGINLTTAEPSSSGAGKSRMWKLFLYLFYGKKALGDNESIKQAEVLGKNFRLETAFTRYGKTYLVRETRNHDDFEDGYALYEVKDGKLIKEGEVNDPRMLRARVQRILGMTYGEMTGMVIWPQGFGHSLVVGKPSERINFLSSVYGLTKYDDIHDSLSNKLKEVKAKISLLLSVEGEYNAVVASTANGASVEDLKVKHTTLSSQVAQAEGKVAAYRAELNALHRKLDRLESMHTHWVLLKDLSSKLLPQELTLLEQRSLVFTFDKSCAKMKQDLERLYDIKAGLNRINELKAAGTATSISNIEDARKRLRFLDSSVIPKLRNVHIVSKEDLASFVKGRDEAKSRVMANCKVINYRPASPKSVDDDAAKAARLVVEITQELQHEDAALKELCDLKDELLSADESQACRCPKCKQSVDTQRLDKMIAAQKKKLEAVDARLVHHENVESRMYAIADDYSTWTKLAEAVKAGEASLPVADQLAKAEAEADRLYQDIAKADANAQVVAELSMLTTKYGKYNLETIDKHIRDYSSRIAENDKKRLMYVDAEHAKATVDESLDALSLSHDDTLDLLHLTRLTNQEADVLDVKIKSLSSKITQGHVTLANYKRTIIDEVSRKRKLNDLQSKVDELKALREKEYVINQTLPAYSNAGLKMEKLQNLLAALAERLPYWTKLLFTEKNFFIEVKGDSKKLSLISPREMTIDGKKKTVKVDVASLSGGEQSRVAICLMLAMSDIVATSKRANMIVFDEVDRHMDLLGQRLLASFMVPNLRKKKSALYLISHSSMINPDSFDRKLTITKHPTGISDIKYAATKKRM